MLFSNHSYSSPIQRINDLIARQHELLTPEEQLLADSMVLVLPKGDPRQKMINDLDDLICQAESELN